MVSEALTNLDRFTNSYFIEKHVIEEALKALKERHLIAKGVSPGIRGYNNSSAEGATLIIYVPRIQFLSCFI